LLGLASFRLGRLCTELHRRQLIFSGYDTRLGLLQSSRRVLQLAIGLTDEFTSRALSSFNSLVGKL
jgi:hypothetical protein